MKLYIKQKVFSWKDKFTIKDEYGADRYFVEGEVFSFHKPLHIYDSNNNEVACVRTKLFSWLPRYQVYIGDEIVAVIVKDFTFFRQSFHIEGSIGWTVEGNMWCHEYTINDGSSPVAFIEKAWFTWGDSYEISIVEGADELMALAVVLAIDCAIEESNNSSYNN